MTPEDKPKLRSDLDITPASAGGRQVFVVRDRLGLIERPVVLNSEAIRVIGLLDGSRTLSDLKMAMVRQRGGILLVHDEAEKLVSDLDTAFLLDTHRFRQARALLVRDFRGPAGTGTGDRRCVLSRGSGRTP